MIREIRGLSIGVGRRRDQSKRRQASRFLQEVCVVGQMLDATLTGPGVN